MSLTVETDRLNDILKWEQENLYSREQVTVLSGQDLPVGAVIGKVKTSTPATGTADAGNTGDGTCTGVTSGAKVAEGTYTITCKAAPDVPDDGAAKGVVTAGTGNTGNGTIGDVAVATDAVVGDYTLECIEPGADAGNFRVEDPNGDFVGDATVAVEFTGGGLTFTIADGATDFIAGDSFSIAVPTDGTGGEWEIKTPSGEELADRAVVGTGYTGDHLNFTLNASTTDFVVGDIFTVAVAAGTLKVKAIDFDAVDGSEDPYGFTIDAYDASDADKSGVAVVRDAIIDPDYLAWPMEFTSGGTDVPRVGDTLVGATSSDTAEIAKITVSSGSWAGGDAAGILWVRQADGEFQAENLDIDDRSITNFATIAAGLTIDDNLDVLAAAGIVQRTGA